MATITLPISMKYFFLLTEQAGALRYVLNDIHMARAPFMLQKDPDDLIHKFEIFASRKMGTILLHISGIMCVVRFSYFPMWFFEY